MERLYKEGHDYAGVLSTVLCKIKPNTVEYSDEDFKWGERLWIEILDKILYALDADNNEPVYDGGWLEGECHGEEVGEDYYRYEMNPVDSVAWIKYTEDQKIHTEKVKEGMELFGEHYFDMWW